MRLTEVEWELAQQVCTRRQLDALGLWRRGAGWKRIALTLGIDPSTAKGHVRAARKRVDEALLESAA